MALTVFQKNICRLLAQRRIEGGESYIAGGVALNVLTEGSRISRDIDLFHDSSEALQMAWQADRDLLEEEGFHVEVVRERPSFIEAVVGRGKDQVMVQWARDSAFRFFPLVLNDELGLTLHPFDLATNKMLALVGRLEIRDWIDIIRCHEKIQPLGLIMWAACGKDPGFGPASILEEARRSSRYTDSELAALSFEGERPDIHMLSREWHGILRDAEMMIDILPPDETGKCVLTSDGSLFQGNVDTLKKSLAEGSLLFHEGRLKGAFPEVRSKM